MSKTIHFNIQWDEETHHLAERAALASGFENINAYIINLVQKDVLEVPNRITLSNAQFDNFIKVCENPPEPSVKLRKATKWVDKMK